MNIVPVTVEQNGPGIDLSDQPEGIAIQMSDPAGKPIVNCEVGIVNCAERTSGDNA